MIDALAEVEREATHPTGWRRAVRGTLGVLANTLPEVALVATAGILLYNFIVKQETPGLFADVADRAGPAHGGGDLPLLILLLLPVRWPAIRERFRDKLGKRLDEELERVFLPIPIEIANALQDERAQVDTLLAETKEVAEWLSAKQQAAQVAQLYGA